MCDCGANAECTPEYLLQFAYLGSFYAQRVQGVERPRAVSYTHLDVYKRQVLDLCDKTVRIPMSEHCESLNAAAAAAVLLWAAARDTL